MAQPAPEARAEIAPEPEIADTPPLAEPLETIAATLPHYDDEPPAADAVEREEMESSPAAETSPSLMEPEPAPPRVILPRKKPLPVREPKIPVEKIVHAKQEVLQFESVTRGRFEKSEPTIVEGQDLDVPTFLRKNVRVK